jgi:hypothetical protein
MNLDRWKKLAILVPLAPYLALTVVLLVAALGVTYYRWKAEIRRAAQAELLNQQAAVQIAALRQAAAAAENRAKQVEPRVRELEGKLQKSAMRSQQLAAELEKAKAAAANDQARLAALTPVEVAAEVAAQLGAPGSDAALRGTLEIMADRDGCQEQSLVKDQQLANCEERNSIFNVQRSELLSQVGDLKQALDLEKRAFDARDDLAKVQVKTAQGTWIHRAWNKVKFPVGIVLGGVGGYAVGRAMR